MSPRKLLAQLDADELAHWRIMYRLGAFGSPRDDYRAGTVAAAARNAGRTIAAASGARLSGEPWRVGDFFPQTAPKRSKQDRQKEIARRLRLWQREWER